MTKRKMKKTKQVRSRYAGPKVMPTLKTIPLKWIPERHDTDGDGVPNCRDCDPLDPTKQGREFGLYKIDRDPDGREIFGIYRQAHMGASMVKKGTPLFIGTKEECEDQLRQIPYNPHAHRATW